MHKLTEQEGFDRLRPFHLDLFDGVHAAWEKLQRFRATNGGEFAAPLKTSRLAGLLHDYVVEEMRIRLSDTWEYSASSNVDLFKRGDIVLRFKKEGENGVPSNIPTDHNDMLCNNGQQTLFEDDVHFVAIVHRVAPGWSGIECVEAVKLNTRKDVGWAYGISKDAEAPPMQQYMTEFLELPNLPKVSEQLPPLPEVKPATAKEDDDKRQSGEK